MQKKLRITLDERSHARFSKDLEIAYRQMAQDESRESEALEWAEASYLMICGEEIEL